MIKLTNIIKEVESEEQLKLNTYSWQKPDGTFKPVVDNHGSDVRKRLLFIYPNLPQNTDFTVEMWKRGWNRIWHDGYDHCLYCHNEIQPPNDKQKAALIDLAMRLEFQEVEYDGGEDSKILWSVHDVLQENLAKQG